MMSKRKLLASVAAVILALSAGGAGIAYATGGEVTGPDAEKAKSAALAAVGGGTVTEVERDDGAGAFEVEVKRDDGSQVEVHLDRDLNVVGQEADEDGPNDD